MARPGSGNDSDDSLADSAARARAAGRRVKARPLRPGQQGRVSLNLECRLFRPCGSPGRRLGRRRCPGTPGRCQWTLEGPPGGRAAGSTQLSESLSHTRPGVLALGIRGAGSLGPGPTPTIPVDRQRPEQSHGLPVSSTGRDTPGGISDNEMDPPIVSCLSHALPS